MKHNLKTLQIYYKKYTNEAEEYLDKLIKELEHLKQKIYYKKDSFSAGQHCLINEILGENQQWKLLERKLRFAIGIWKLESLWEVINLGNPFQETKKKNQQLLKEIIRENQPIKHNVAVAKIGMEGVTEKTANKYLKTLLDAGFIKYDTETKTYSVIESA